MRALAVTSILIAVLATACGGDDDDDDGGSTSETPANAATPEASASSANGTPSGPTPTLEAFMNARQTVDSYIRNQLGEDHAGPCPTGTAPPQPPQGLCSTQLFESAELTTFLIGVPYSEGIGELVLTRDAAGQVWTVTFVTAPVLGQPLAVGKTAVAFGAGDCLRFRQTPALNGQVATCQLDGTTGAVVEGPVMAGGITWWRLEGLGWASAEFLGVAAE
jgi:hypothetical protein